MNKMEHVSLRDSNGKHTSWRVASAILATNYCSPLVLCIAIEDMKNMCIVS
jgi:hypothetical protein